MLGLTITPLVCFAVVKITFGKSNSSGLHLKADALANKCKNNTNLRPCVNSCLCVNFNLVACLLHVCKANCVCEIACRNVSISCCTKNRFSPFCQAVIKPRLDILFKSVVAQCDSKLPVVTLWSVSGHKAGYEPGRPPIKYS